MVALSSSTQPVNSDQHLERGQKRVHYTNRTCPCAEMFMSKEPTSDYSYTLIPSDVLCSAKAAAGYDSCSPALTQGDINPCSCFQPCLEYSDAVCMH